MSIDQCTTIKTGGSVPICFPWQAGGGQGVTYDKDKAGAMSKSQTLAVCITGDRTHALKAEGADASAMGTGSKQGTATIAISQGPAVRRLTPRECERLQGWPDDHTLVPYRGKPMADGPRYKIVGNGWALPCVQWIGRRIVTEMGP